MFRSGQIGGAPFHAGDKNSVEANQAEDKLRFLTQVPQAAKIALKRIRLRINYIFSRRQRREQKGKTVWGKDNFFRPLFSAARKTRK